MALRNAQKKRSQKRRLQKSSQELRRRKSHDIICPTGDNFELFYKRFFTLRTSVKSIKTVHLNSNALRDQIKAVVKDYFSQIRPALVNSGVETKILDEMAQALLKMTNARTATPTYKKTFDEMNRELVDIEAAREFLKSDLLVKGGLYGASQISVQDNAIISTLEKFVLASAISYKQVLQDLQLKKLSYRGTAAELREVLREVLDHLAPDKEVMAVSGFKFEPNRNQPTMKQKVRFILKNRNKSATAIEAPEEAASVVDESIAKLTRATYDRGSTSAHTQSDGTEILQIKRYLDSVLCELLEIHF